MDRDLSNRVCVGVGSDAPTVTVRELQATLFPPMSPTGPDSTIQLPRLGSGSFLGSFLLKSNQVLVGEERPGAPVARLREPRELFALGREQPCPAQQAARWPAECQVIDERVEHISYNPSAPEQYYESSGREAAPKPLGEDFGTVVYQYYPVSAINYFNRSCTGGSPYLQSQVPEQNQDDLQFESRFESGNLAKAIKLTTTFYELYVRTDLYTNRHTQWFYFRISNVKRNMLYRFSIVNLSKVESLYTCGMKPLMYSTKDAKLHSIGWRRCGENIAYFCNENGNSEEDQPPTYTLSFTLEFPHDGDVVYLAHSYPYTYTDLQDYLMALANHPVKSAYSSLRLLCRSLAGNNVYYVTVTSPSQQAGDQKKKKAIVITARVHPGESPSSWMMKGLLDFLTGDTGPARNLRDKFIFKLVPMLNPDGVIVGNSRCSLTGRDLNRQYRTVIRETYPSIWHTKLMVRRLIEECGVAMYCDFHAHSRQNNVFIYGCENRRGYDRYLHEQVFPLMLHKNAADKFSFENCKFRVQRVKEGTGRVVMWMMGICNSYTMEASFSGSDLGPRVDTHFSTGDYESMGRAFCQTLLDFYDDAPNKEKLRCKILKRLVKRGSTADEPTNINLSDYSSDEGDSSSSDEAGRDRDSPPLVVPPPSPNLPQKIPKKKTAPPIKNISKSPNVQRKVLPMYHTTLGLSLAETDSSDSDTGNETASTRTGRAKARKILRRKKTKKINKIRDQEHSDTELQVKKHSRKSLSVLELIPAEKLRSQSWNRFAGFPVPKALDIRHVRNTTRQLAEVQAKLITLRQRIWSGFDNGDHQPLSWGYSSFSTTNISNETRETSKKIKDSKKSKSCDEEKKTEKKQKKKCKRQKEETKKPPQKKKSNGIKRQTAVDWTNYDNRRQAVKSKSLENDSNARILERRQSITESCGDLDDRKKKTKKKKKKKGNWEKKTKTLVNVNAFVRKVIVD